LEGSVKANLNYRTTCLRMGGQHKENENTFY